MYCPQSAISLSRDSNTHKVRIAFFAQRWNCLHSQKYSYWARFIQRNIELYGKKKKILLVCFVNKTFLLNCQLDGVIH